MLELNCGTGEDAVHLARRGVSVLATDASPAMVERARAKAEAAGVADRVETRLLPFEALGELAGRGFDGALSDFGGLNCAADLAPVARGLAAALRPEAVAVLCLMGPVVPWEWLWFLARGRPGRAFRRLRPGGDDWRGLRVRYPTAGRTRRLFGAGFRPLRTAALGALLPPPYAEEWARRRRGWVLRLDRWERRLETVFPLPALADHYLLELERR